MKTFTTRQGIRTRNPIGDLFVRAETSDKWAGPFTDAEVLAAVEASMTKKRFKLEQRRFDMWDRAGEHRVGSGMNIIIKAH